MDDFVPSMRGIWPGTICMEGELGSKEVPFFQFQRSPLWVSVKTPISEVYIALTSTVSKVMCTVLNNRSSCVAEDEGLIAEEQAGFRKHRGCRDQVLALVLLSQMEVAKKAVGMIVAFIDF